MGCFLPPLLRKQFKLDLISFDLSGCYPALFDVGDTKRGTGR